MINALNSSSKEYGLHINLSKTKIVVFRNRGCVKDCEKWFLDNNLINVCDNFVYLGLFF